MYGSDFLYLAIVFFVVGMVAILVVFAGQNVLPLLIPIINVTPGAGQPVCQAGGSMVNTPYCTQTAYNDSASIFAYTKNFDPLLVLIFFIVSIAICASVLFLPANPIAIGISFLIMIFSVVICMEFANVIGLVLSQPMLANAVVLFPQTEVIFGNLGYIELAFFFIYIILLAARSKLPNFGGGGGIGGGGGNIGGPMSKTGGGAYIGGF